MVGKSDFNENPVVSLDLDLDFGLRLRVCQYSGSKPYFYIIDNNPIKLLHGKEKGGREGGRILAETLKVPFFLTY